MPKSTSNRKSALPPERSSTLTVNEIRIVFIVITMVFIVITIAVFAIITGNVLLLLVDLIFVAFVLAGPTPSTFKEFLDMLRNLFR